MNQHIILNKSRQENYNENHILKQKHRIKSNEIKLKTYKAKFLFQVISKNKSVVNMKNKTEEKKKVCIVPFV